MTSILSSLRRPGLVATLATAVACVATSTAHAAVSPTIDRSFGAPTPNTQADPFYTPPSPLPTGNPGDVLRARPAQAGPPTARSLADAYQVMYLSTSALGQPETVTGTVLIPKNVDRSKLNIVALGPGTTGPAFRCTVSRFINSGAFYEQPMLNALLKAGYAVTVTDYDGYYPGGKPTYIVGRAMGPAMLDAVRAAERLPEAGLSSTAKVATQGFSQGGGASMWAGTLAPTYAPELNLVGVSAGGVPADLAKVAIAIEGKPAFGFILPALVGLDNAYPDLLLGNYETDSGKAALDAMNADDCTLELLTKYVNGHVLNYLSRSPVVTPPWAARIAENKLGDTAIKVPVFQYHAANDPIVSFGQATLLRDQECKLGVPVQWKDYLTTGHITTVARGIPDVLTFLADRFAGKTPTNTCATTTPDSVTSTS